MFLIVSDTLNSLAEEGEVKLVVVVVDLSRTHTHLNKQTRK